MDYCGGKHMDLSLLLFLEKGCWVAQCIEYDLTAQAETIDDVLYEFQRTLVSETLIRKELNLPPLEDDLPPAPEVYRRQFQKAARLEKTIPRMIAASVTIKPSHAEIRIAA